MNAYSDISFYPDASVVVYVYCELNPARLEVPVEDEGSLARSAAEGLRQAISAYLIYFLPLRNKTAEFRDIYPLF